ncbi:MAG: hypothetical protein AAF125_14025 [Chloroflexota bacterium]
MTETAVATPTEEQSPVETQDSAESTVLTPIPDNYFLLHPQNEHVIRGEGDRHLPPNGARIILLIGLPGLFLGLGLAGYTVVRWMDIIPVVQAGTAAPPDTIANGALWTAGALLVNLFVVGFYLSGASVLRKRRALARRGEVLWGVVTIAEGRIDRFDDLQVAVEYRFKKPKRWRFSRDRHIEGRISEDRNDLKGKSLPSPGTPLAVLYLNEDNYEIL